MSNLYSVNALAIELQRDRGTVTRALKDVDPDGYEHSQPRWKISTAVRALERRSYRPMGRNQKTGRKIDEFDFRRPTRLDALRSDYDEGLLAISDANTKEAKRKLALKIAPLLQQYQFLFEEVARSLNACDDDLIPLRGEMIFREMMGEVSQAAEWPRDSGRPYEDFWSTMSKAMESQTEADDESDEHPVADDATTIEQDQLAVEIDYPALAYALLTEVCILRAELAEHQRRVDSICHLDVPLDPAGPAGL